MGETPDTQKLSIAAAEKLQRQTCKWLCFATTALFVVVTAAGLLGPEERHQDVLGFEPWHAGVTAALLLWGWRGGGLARGLAILGLALGMLYLAPFIFGLGMLIFLPSDVKVDRDSLQEALVYLGALLVYYGVALALMYRAHHAAKKAILKRD
jgi:hypothetical protein